MNSLPGSPGDFSEEVACPLSFKKQVYGSTRMRYLKESGSQRQKVDWWLPPMVVMVTQQCECT